MRRPSIPVAEPGGQAELLALLSSFDSASTLACCPHKTCSLDEISTYVQPASSNPLFLHLWVASLVFVNARGKTSEAPSKCLAGFYFSPSITEHEILTPDFFISSPMMTRRLLRSLILFAALASALAAQMTVPIGGFTPKKLPAIIALWNLSTDNRLEYFRLERRPFMLTLTLGMTAMAAGFVLRIVFSNSPFSFGLYIIMDMLILLSPCAFLATDYMLLARLASTFPEEVSQSCLLIRPSRIVKFFVWSDGITFFLQASGGGLTATKNASTANIGNKITMIGLSLQLASFALFTVLILVFGWRVKNRFPAAWAPPAGSKPFTLLGTHQVGNWRILFWTLCVTCIGILVRSIFRIAEFAGGYNGFLAVHEGYFYLFDSLPLWIAMSLYCVVWPTRFLNSRQRAEGIELRKEAGGV
ncbi:RTA1 like protein-domain-containing protein [Mycena vulgaris]|nr:RTA1 like protein-domain-containing protein [Mycena vulgaris]